MCVFFLYGFVAVISWPSLFHLDEAFEAANQLLDNRSTYTHRKIEKYHPENVYVCCFFLLCKTVLIAFQTYLQHFCNRPKL